MIYIWPFHDGGPYHIETRANQWTNFYMIGTSVMKKLNTYNLLEMYD